MAHCRRAQELFDEAEALFRRALAVCVEAHGPSHEDTKNVATGLWNVLEETDRDAEAEALNQQYDLNSDRSLLPCLPAFALYLGLIIPRSSLVLSLMHAPPAAPSLPPCIQ